MTLHLFASLWRDQRKIYWTSETNLQNYITARWPSLYRWVVLFLFVSLFARLSYARIHSSVQSQSEVLRKIPSDHRAAVYSVFNGVFNSFLNYHFQLGHVLQVGSWLCMTVSFFSQNCSIDQRMVKLQVLTVMKSFVVVPTKHHLWFRNWRELLSVFRTIHVEITRKYFFSWSVKRSEQI